MLRGTTVNLSASDASALVSNFDANQSASPTTGQTVTLTNSNLDGSAAITPAGTLAALTITLPTEGSSRINQARDIWISQAITALTINGAVTIVGNITASVANVWITAKKVAANTWILRVT
jgi:hypothetical protein